MDVHAVGGRGVVGETDRAGSLQVQGQRVARHIRNGHTGIDHDISISLQG